MTRLLSELLPFALLGLLGAAHCAGMCGGFALGVSLAAGNSRLRALRHSLAYLLGKSLSYSVLGLLASRGAHGLAHAAAAGDPTLLESVRRGLAWASGIVCLLLALLALGVPLVPMSWRVGPASQGAPRPWLAWMFRSAQALPGTSRSFGIGLANGLLPCGLSWSALALAAGSTPAIAALGLLVFGTATAPVLLATAASGHLLPVSLRMRLRPLGALLLIAFALLTIVRGGVPIPLAGGGSRLPACCQTQGVEGGSR